MKISIQPNPVKSGKYRVVLHTGRIEAMESFLKYAETSSTVGRSDVRAVFEVARNWIVFNASDGQEVDLGPLGRSRLGMKGDLTDIDQKIMDSDVEMSISWILPNEMKNEIRTLGDEILREHIGPDSKAPEILTARLIMPDSTDCHIANSYQSSSPLRLSGYRLDYDYKNEDEGVFLIPDGLMASDALKVGRMMQIKPNEIILIMPDLVSGQQTVEIRRRWPRNSTNIQRARLKISPME